ncbi:methyltransferase domain-containing protein, partial [Eubacteriales bacterium OttesenSCG-928-A19]|nr:methyltransferase domain-containing protein [Eubacteriales bacterium OttesenSCG-928-A19]
AYATDKASSLGIDCAFVSGDACGLPFAADTFDLCFSYTVMNFCDPDLFAAEQYRVLKAGGHMVAMDVVKAGNGAERWVPVEASEEKHLFDRLWDAARRNERSHIARHSDSKRQWAISMEKAGFSDITLRALATVAYCPDSHEVGQALAIEQVNVDRLNELCSVEKAMRMVPTALTGQELARLNGLINTRYDTRLEQYERGERLWDYGVTTVLAVIGSKKEKV